MSGASRPSQRQPKASWRLLARGLVSLVVLALLAVTLQSLVLSGASFSDVDATTSASLLAGSVSHTNSAGTMLLSADYLRPGLSSSGTLTITGGPDVPATYTLTCVSLSDAPASPGLSATLQLRIDDVTGGAVLYRGAANGFTSTTLGVIADAQSRQYTFTLTYPTAAADRALMGATMAMQFEFVGVSL